MLSLGSRHERKKEWTKQTNKTRSQADKKKYDKNIPLNKTLSPLSQASRVFYFNRRGGGGGAKAEEENIC